MTTNPRTIIAEIGEWSKRQRQVESTPDLNTLESFGKVLKAIRQEDKEADALGTLMICLSEWCYIYDAYYTIPSVTPIAQSLRHRVSQCMIALTQLVDASGPEVAITTPKAVSIATRVALTMHLLACSIDLDLLEDCLYPTWDWIKDKQE